MFRVVCGCRRTHGQSAHHFNTRSMSAWRRLNGWLSKHFAKDNPISWLTRESLNFDEYLWGADTLNQRIKCTSTTTRDLINQCSLQEMNNKQDPARRHRENRIVGFLNLAERPYLFLFGMDSFTLSSINCLTVDSTISPGQLPKRFVINSGNIINRLWIELPRSSLSSALA